MAAWERSGIDGKCDGVTVFTSSHILAEVDRLFTRIGIIRKGQLIEELEAEEEVTA